MTWTDELVVRVYTYTQSRTVNPLVVTIRPSISLPRHQLRPPAFYRRQRPFCRAWHRDIGSVAPRSSFIPAISQKCGAKKALADTKAVEKVNTMAQKLKARRLEKKRKAEEELASKVANLKPKDTMNVEEDSQLGRQY